MDALYAHFTLNIYLKNHALVNHNDMKSHKSQNYDSHNYEKNCLVYDR